MHAMGKEKKKKRLPEPRFRTQNEREIMRVLWSHQEQSLVRSQVRAKMALPPRERPTTARIGQVLKALAEHGYVDVEPDRFQGNRRAAFYSLNEEGLAVCRRRYRFDVESIDFFPLRGEHASRYLTAKHFAGHANAPARKIVGLYSYRGGLGQTSMTAYTGAALAELLKDKRVLLVDLDIDNPELNRFFPPRVIAASQGLSGLEAEYRRQPASRRRAWLGGALGSEAYAVPCGLPEYANLFYLPLGEWAGRRNLSQALMAELSRPSKDGSASFIDDVRQAILENFQLTLVDSHGELSLSAALTIRLADLLLINSRPETRERHLEGIKTILAAFCAHRAKSSAPSSGAFVVLHLSEFSHPDFDGAGWIHDKLLDANSEQASPELTFRFWILMRRGSLTDEVDWRLREIFQPLARFLTGVPTAEAYLPPEVTFLASMLDPQTPTDHRRILLSFLLGLSFGEVAHSLQMLTKTGSMKPSTDRMGLESLEELFRVHFEKIIKNLKVVD